jgi:hypothetical protein
MGLLKDFLVIDAARRRAQDNLRAEAMSRRDRILELTSEAQQKRDAIGVMEQELERVAEDLVRTEQEILELDRQRDQHEDAGRARKVAAVRAVFSSDRLDGARVAADFRRLRSEFQKERERLLAQTDTGRMMDNFFQIESFLKDTGQPIPDAARKALAKERADLLAKVGPLVAPPPSPDGILRATVAWSGLHEPKPRAIVALGLPDEGNPCDAADLPAAILYGGYALAVERFGNAPLRPRREAGVLVFEMPVPEGAPEEQALELFLAVEEGMKKAAAAASVRCELTGVFVEPEIAAAAFAAGK